MLYPARVFFEIHGGEKIWFAQSEMLPEYITNAHTPHDAIKKFDQIGTTAADHAIGFFAPQNSPGDIPPNASNSDKRDYDFTVYIASAYDPEAERGAYAFIVLKGDVELARGSGACEKVNAKRVDLRGIINGLRAVPQKNGVIRIVTNSRYITDTIMKRNEVRQYKELWTEFEGVSANFDIDCQVIRGHCGDEYRGVCIKEANAVLEKQKENTKNET